VDESEALIKAALHILRVKGDTGFTVNDVLGEAGLRTRAFYRHFASKDDLVVAAFAEGARAEATRLRRRMAHASGPLEGVVTWIDARLDLGFDRRLAANLRPLSQEAERAHGQFPAHLRLAFDRMLAPLIEQLQQGQLEGTFGDLSPAEDALAIHQVVWGVVEQRWSGFPLRYRETREQVLRFCLGGLGVESSVLHEAALHHGAARPERLRRTTWQST
jgi:AcrR family transcriptional regulator